ncbi:PREDICTED: IQ domain-containing protein E [Myotis davidii]|uniref:IQ domain-containing protein E n=1 Tax=Myotis davidii TaxID=225400 RepID=UPI00076776F2|nr:PREDICTED: IQ domain-containing protein E [Myotis davidii]
MPLGSRTPLTPQRLWLGSAKQGLAPGTPVYREKEDMYDEIMDLKKSLHMQRSDADLLRTKLRRLEEENSRKDRQIEQLLDPSRGPDFVWTLGEKRPDAGWVSVSCNRTGSLAARGRRLLSRAPACLPARLPLTLSLGFSKLQADMKTTSLEEMRVAMETYYEEIHRLQTLLASSEPSGRKYDDLVLHSLLWAPLPWLRRCPPSPAHCQQHVPVPSLSTPTTAPLSVAGTGFPDATCWGDTTQGLSAPRRHRLSADREALAPPRGSWPPWEGRCVGRVACSVRWECCVAPSAGAGCLSRSLQELTEENQSLKEDLDRVLSSSPTVARTKGCVEWSKPRLLRRIAELEKKIRSLESPPPQAPDGGRSDALALCVSSTWGHRQPRPEPQEDGERQEDSERLRGALRSLKGERKALRAQLQERDLEVRQLLQAKADVEKELEEVRRGEEARRAREAALREEIQALTRKCQDLQAAKEAEEDDPTEGTPEVQPLREAFSSHVSPELSLGGKDVARGGSSGGVLQAMRVGPQVPQSQSDRHSSHSGFSFKARLGTAFTPEGPRLSEPGASEDSPSQPCACSEQRRHAAASTLQARWKVYRRQKREAALDEAATVLQAAFRGHLARARLLASPAPFVRAEGDPRQEAAVTLIQSVFRAHLARVRHRTGALPAASTRSPVPATLSAPSPPAPPVAPAGQEDGEVSGRDAMEGPAPQPCPAEPSPSSAPWEDVSSDDSDEVIMAPALPVKRSPSLPPTLGACGRAAHGDAPSAES